MTAARDHVETADQLLDQAAAILAVQLDYRRTLPGHTFNADEAVYVEALASIARGYTSLAAAAALNQLADLVQLDTAAATSLRELVELAAPARTADTDGEVTR